MARWDGSGDISFTPTEFRKIAEEMLAACDRCPEGEYLTISRGVLLNQRQARVEIRHPRF